MKKFIPPAIGFVLGMVIFWLAGNDFVRGTMLVEGVLFAFSMAFCGYIFFIHEEK